MNPHLLPPSSQIAPTDRGWGHAGDRQPHGDLPKPIPEVFQVVREWWSCGIGSAGDLSLAEPGPLCRRRLGVIAETCAVL